MELVLIIGVGALVAGFVSGLALTDSKAMSGRSQGILRSTARSGRPGHAAASREIQNKIYAGHYYKMINVQLKPNYFSNGEWDRLIEKRELEIRTQRAGLSQ